MILVFDLEISGTKSFKRIVNAFDPRNEITVVTWQWLPDPKIYCVESKKGLDPKQIVEKLRFKDANLIVGQNVKFDLLWLWKHIRDLDLNVWDTMLAEHILSGFYFDAKDIYSYKDLDTLSKRYGGTVKDSAVSGFLKSGGIVKDYANYPELLEYAKNDARNTAIVFNKQLEKAKNLKMLPLIKTFMEHYVAVCEMEYNGLHIDRESAFEYKAQIEQKIKDNELEINKYVNKFLPDDYPFNPSSPTQISTLLFGGTLSYSVRQEMLTPDGLPVLYKTKNSPNYGKPKFKLYPKVVETKGMQIVPIGIDKTKAGYFSVDEKTISKCLSRSHDEDQKKLLTHLLEHRKLSKLLGTYLYVEEKGVAKGLLSLINPNTNAIHPEWKTAAVATGRMACSNPNIQNIPPDIYKFITPRFEEGHIYSIDFSQLEVVVAGFLSQDDVLIQALIDGTDLHKRSATFLYDIPLNQVTPAQRKTAKEVTFQLFYGAHFTTISERMGLELTACERFVEKFYDLYKGVKLWHESLEQNLDDSCRTTRIPMSIFDKANECYYTEPGETERYGYITSLIGQRWRIKQKAVKTKRGIFRYWPATDMKNYSVQGTATVLVNLTIAELYKNLQKHRDQVILVSEIHDEVWLECAKNAQSLTEEIINTSFGKAQELFKRRFKMEFNVPVRYEYFGGRTISEAKKL